MEAAKNTFHNSSHNNSPVQWTRHALNYRIPRRGANYMLFSIVVDSFFALLIPFFILNMTASVINIPLWGFLGCILVSRILTFNALGIYSSSEQPRFITEVSSVSVAVLASILMVLGMFYLTQTALLINSIALIAGTALVAHLSWRTVVYFWSYYQTIRSILAPRRVLIIGANKSGRDLEATINKFPLPTTRVVGYLDNDLTQSKTGAAIIGSLNANIFEIIRDYNVDEIILTTTRQVERENSSAIVNLQYAPVPVRLIPDYMKLNAYTSNADSLEQLPLIRLRQPAMAAHNRLFKRAMDIMVASIGLLVTLPFFSTIAFLVWLNDKGPIFFKQERYGENGKIFHMLKFRSMVVNAPDLVDEVAITDDDGKTIYKRKHDPRVTAIGRIIRKTSLDELPQLLNIIRGDMSIVGPRPEVRSIVEKEYEPWQFERMRVPQGLTGWWQINGRGETQCYQATDQDIYYVQNHSIWLDIKIVLMTIPALLKAKGAF